MLTQDIRYVDAILSNDPGNMSHAQYRQLIDEYTQLPMEKQDYHTDDAGTSTFCINRLQTDGMTEEEKQLKSFSSTGRSGVRRATSSLIHTLTMDALATQYPSLR